MASASCATSVGFRSSAEPGTTNSVSCATLAGFASAAAPVAWGGSDAPRKVTDWLPKIGAAIAEVKDNNGRVIGKAYMTPILWKYLNELGQRIGGIQGQSIPQVVQIIADTQVQVAANTNLTVKAIDYTASVAATATATAQVAQTNGLSGSGSIPEPAERPRSSDTLAY